MSADDAALLGRAQRAEAELRRHKSAIRQHRISAQTAAAALDAIRDECARRGIAPDARAGRASGAR